MNKKIEKFVELLRETRQAHKRMVDKRSDLLVYENYDIKKVGCIKIVPYQVQNLSDSTTSSPEMHFYTRFCESFCEDTYCQNQYCPIHKRNVEYVESIKVYKALRKARNQAFRDIFTRKK